MNFKMIGTGIAAIAMVAVSFAAGAADMPVKGYRSVIAYYNWTGFYVGINGGYGWGRADWVTPPPVSFNTSGYLIGGTVGFNYQTGSIVWGIEGDLDYSTVRGTGDPAICGTPTCETRMLWIGTARARIGYAFDRWLPFITGGAAIAGLRHTGNDASETKTKLGWTAGVGLEYAFMRAWSAKIEYLYTDLGTTTCTTCFTGFPQDIRYRVNMVRLGVNYRF